MSSETSTDTHSFRSWHLFVLAALLASTVALLVARPDDPVILAILIAAIGSGAGVGFAFYYTLKPLTVQKFKERSRIVGGRTRAALEREKILILRSIKELEFDRAMGKMSDEDFEEMSRRLRLRALTLMKQLDVEEPEYREMINKELVRRLGLESNDLGLLEDVSEVGGFICEVCKTENDEDAKFCKGCGALLEATR